MLRNAPESMLPVALQPATAFAPIVVDWDLRFLRAPAKNQLPSQPLAASRTASKMRRRLGVISAISMTVPGWPSLRK